MSEFIIFLLFSSFLQSVLAVNKGWSVVDISQLMKKESRNRYLLSTKLFYEPIICHNKFN
ncbi:hypothetical protein BpHYR1_042583 [Brachionus plicatilis]|uniref:Uncharacterized protein n=1 Tax=Brachionus plicatilis TaxID=10195 RepID=A0A3M7QQF5_BRAPC|nr:hypothetical protein BpHYR1_042583 [Brachionus plicatilis]